MQTPQCAGKRTNKQIEHHTGPRRVSATATLRTGGGCEPLTRRDYAQNRKSLGGAVPGQKQKRTTGRLTMCGRTNKQEGEGRQHGCGRGRRQAGAHRRRHTKQERCDKSHTLELHAPRGTTAQGSSGVEDEREKTGCGSNNRGTIGRKGREQHRLGGIRSRTRPQELSWSSQRRVIAREPSKPVIAGHASSKSSMWRHDCSRIA